MDKYKRLLKNTVIVFLGNIGTKLLQFLLLPLYTRWMTPAEYGTVDLITVYGTIFLSLVSCQIQDSIFLFPNRKSFEQQKKYFSSGLLFAFFTTMLALLAVAVGGTVLKHIESRNVLTDYIWMIYLYMALSLFQNYTQQFCRSIDKMVVYSISGFLVTVSMVFFAFVLVRPYGMKGYLISLFASQFISILYMIFAAHLPSFFSFFCFDYRYLVHMLKYSLPLVPTTLMWWIIYSSNRPLLEKYCSISEIGLFVVANKFPTLLAVVYTIFGNAWQISVVEEFRSAQYVGYFNRVFDLFFLIMLGCAVGLTMCSKWLIILFTGSAYHSSWVFMPLLAMGIVFSNLSGFIATNFTAAKKSMYYLYSAGAAIIIALCLNFILIPRFGVWGATFSICGSLFSLLVIRCIFAARYVRISGVPGKTILTICTFLLICLTLQDGDSILSFCAGGALFLVLAVLFFRKLDPRLFRKHVNP